MLKTKRRSRLVAVVILVTVLVIGTVAVYAGGEDRPGTLILDSNKTSITLDGKDYPFKTDAQPISSSNGIINMSSILTTLINDNASMGAAFYLEVMYSYDNESDWNLADTIELKMSDIHWEAQTHSLELDTDIDFETDGQTDLYIKIAFQGSTTQQTWHFTLDDATDSPNNTNVNDGPNANDSPKTADTTSPLDSFAIMLVSLLVICIVLLVRNIRHTKRSN